MNKEKRLAVMLICIAHYWETNPCWECDLDSDGKETIKENIKELNGLYSVYNHYHKQFIKLTGRSFKFTPRKATLKDFKPVKG